MGLRLTLNGYDVDEMLEHATCPVCGGVDFVMAMEAEPEESPRTETTIYCEECGHSDGAVETMTYRPI